MLRLQVPLWSHAVAAMTCAVVSLSAEDCLHWLQKQSCQLKGITQVPPSAAASSRPACGSLR